MWENLEMIRKIGEGGMGQVWLVHDRVRGERFAAKKLRPQVFRSKDIARFYREVENLRALDHPNIVRLIDASAEGEEPGLLMEYCPGGSIDALVANGTITPPVAIELFWQVMAGLKCAHESPTGIVHRDIKPANILIGADGHAKVSDFGLSLGLRSEQKRVTTSVWYSPGFSPPEQLYDFAAVDHRGDIYSAGCLLHYMLTGRRYDVNKGLDRIAEPTRSFLAPMLAESADDRPATIAKLEVLWRDLTGGH